MRSWDASLVPSVLKVNPEIIYTAQKLYSENQDIFYLGVKDGIPFTETLEETLNNLNIYYHTLDKSSDRGRAIDIELINPITGNFMTGSSSGSAINVFRGYNDIALGSDGGGSVLAPALALNLYGFISPLLCAESMKKLVKKSTDNITFTPSLGFITKDVCLLSRCIEHLLGNDPKSYKLKVAKREDIDCTIFQDEEEYSLMYDNSSRDNLMRELESFDFEHHILCTMEGPVDLHGFGDSVFGHYDKDTKEIQQNAGKYYLSIANMMGLSACIIPSSNLARGYLLLCKSEVSAINCMMEYARQIPFTRSTLETRYFTRQSEDIK